MSITEDVNSPYLPEELVEALAEEIDQISISYQGREADLCLHALAILADEEGYEVIDEALVQRYYGDDRLGHAAVARSRSARRPSVCEAIFETCRRVRDARRIRDALRDTGTAGMLCGSTNYGRFFNVHGAQGCEKPSDLDILVTVPDAEALFSVMHTLYVIGMFDSAEIERLDQRWLIFAHQLDDGRTTFSHKLTLRTGPMLLGDPAPPHYVLSLHFLTQPVLDYVLVKSSPRLLKEAVGSRRTIRDYRETATLRRDQQRTFAGGYHYLNLQTVPVEAGVLRPTGAYSIDATDHYSPGFFQTMLLPQPDLLWDDLGLEATLAEFRRKLAERVRYERDRHTFEMIRPSFAHVRREIFAPRVIRFLDQGYSRP